MDIKQAVMAELDKLAATGEKKPALRVLRARIGGGSLTTISEAVRDWEAAQIAVPLSLPNDLTMGEQKVICGAIWRVLAPMLEERLATAQAAAEAKIDIERRSAAQLREEAEAAIAEAAAQAEELKKLKALVAEQRQTIEQDKEDLIRLEKSNDEYRATIASAVQERDIARREVATLKAEVNTLNRLLPLIQSPAAKAKKGAANK